MLLSFLRSPRDPGGPRHSCNHDTPRLAPLCLGLAGRVGPRSWRRQRARGCGVQRVFTACFLAMIITFSTSVSTWDAPSTYASAPHYHPASHLQHLCPLPTHTSGSDSSPLKTGLPPAFPWSSPLGRGAAALFCFGAGAEAALQEWGKHFGEDAMAWHEEDLL